MWLWLRCWEYCCNVSRVSVNIVTISAWWNCWECALFFLCVVDVCHRALAHTQCLGRDGLCDHIYTTSHLYINPRLSVTLVARCMIALPSASSLCESMASMNKWSLTLWPWPLSCATISHTHLRVWEGQLYSIKCEHLLLSKSTSNTISKVYTFKMCERVSVSHSGCLPPVWFQFVLRQSPSSSLFFSLSHSLSPLF